MLGRYALYAKIASGGMASVHIGRLVGPVGFARTVAIKRMHPHYAEDPEFVSMFLDEARLASRIRHPNVIPTLDVVATGGELFLVMEFVHGESLSKLVRVADDRGDHVPPAIATAILVGVLHGLHAAHEAKNERGEPLCIVHRDVSPQNVLVGVDGVPRVLDFGVAKAAGRLQTTREGQLKGKLAYMAPEQLQGTVSRAADIYSASVVLWEALTGKRMFDGESEGHVYSQVLKGFHEPPSKYAPDIPPGLDAVVMCGLSVDPSHRYATAREMACALEEALAPAMASRVGDWVEASAKTTLDERSARLASIESDSSMHPPPAVLSPTIDAPPQPPARPSRTGSGKVALRDMETAAMPPGMGDELVITQLSSGSISSPKLPAHPTGRSASTAIVLGGGALVLVTAGALTLLFARGAGHPAVVGASPTQRSSAASASAPSGSTPAAAPPLSAAPSTPQPAASTSASAAPSAAPGRRGTQPSTKGVPHSNAFDDRM
jgi:serine/threonine-protein kinase